MNKRSILIIANPAAGGGRSLKVLAKTKAILQTNAVPHKILLTDGPGHAISLAKQAAAAKWPIIATIGGDGTINEVIQGIVNTETALAIIPGGTGNDLARSLSVPLKTHAAVRILLDGVITAIDCGYSSYRAFGALVSIGFPVTVIQYVNSTQGLLKGSPKFLAAVWKTIQHLKAFPAKIAVDGYVRQVNTIGIFVQNTKFAGGGLMIAPDADPADSTFDIVIVHNLLRRELISTLPKAYWGAHKDHPAVEFLRGKQVEIATQQPLPMLFDGEVVGETPLRATIVPAALRVVVAQAVADKINSSRARLSAVQAGE